MKSKTKIKAFIVNDSSYYFSVDYESKSDEEWLGYAFEEELQKSECSIPFPYHKDTWLIVEGDSKKEIRNKKYKILQSYGGREAKDYKKTIDFISSIGSSFSVLRIVGDY